MPSEPRSSDPSESDVSSSADRVCGECSLCCTLLRVDPLAKLAGTPCPSLLPGGTGCSIYAARPPICGEYRCLWLRGGLTPEDRPDRLGAVLDLWARGTDVRLDIRQSLPGSFDRSPRLQQIAARYRETMAVRITDVDDVMNPDRPFRVLLPDGSENRVRGDIVETHREGRRVEIRRSRWLERAVRRWLGWRRFRKLRNYH